MKFTSDFTPAERDLIRQFTRRSEDKKDIERFGEGFDTTIKLDMAKATLEEASSKAYRTRLRKQLRFHENNLTPAPKRAAINRNYTLNKFLRDYLHKHGRPKNISGFISRLSKEGHLDVADAEGNVRTLNDRTVRLMIEGMRRPFSWPKPGRRRATTRRKSVAQHRHEPKSVAKPTRVQPSLPKLKFLEAPLKSAKESAGGSARGRRRPER